MFLHSKSKPLSVVSPIATTIRVMLFLCYIKLKTFLTLPSLISWLKLLTILLIFTILFFWRVSLPHLSLLELLAKGLSNLYLLASAFLAHIMGRDDLLASSKTLMYETSTC